MNPINALGLGTDRRRLCPVASLSLRVALATAVTMFALLIPAPTSSAADCPPFKFVGAAGSGERKAPAKKDYDGVGRILKSLHTSLTAGNGVEAKMIPLVDIDYPANDVAWERISGVANLANAYGFPIGNPFWDSVMDGAEKMVKYTHRLRAGECKSKTKLILAGYSQGAAVVHFAWKMMSRDDRKAIAQIVVFGDPLFAHNDNAYGNYDPTRSGAGFSLSVHDTMLELFKWGKSDPVYSFCNGGDLVCQLNQRAFGYAGGPWVSNPFGVDTDHHMFDSYSANNHLKTAHVLITNRLKLKSLATLPVIDDLRGAAGDIVFAIDTTGSMSDEIDAARDAVNSIATKLSTTSPDFRVALVEYKDYDDSDYLDPFQTRVVLPFTTDVGALRDGLDSLEADGGGDYSESVFAAIDTSLNIGFRPGAKKSVIVIGDAPPKDPEPVTGLTADSIVARAFAAGPVQIFGVFSILDESDRIALRSVITRTGGTMFNLTDSGTYVPSSLALPKDRSDNASDPNNANDPKAAKAESITTASAESDALADALVAAVGATAQSPVVAVSAPATAPQGVPVALSSTVHSGETPASIDWDLNGDGTFDLLGAGRMVSPVLTTLGAVTIVVKYTLADGVVAFGRAAVNVVAPVRLVRGKKLIGKASKVRVKNSKRLRRITFTYTRKSATQPAPVITLVNRRGKTVGGVLIVSTAKRVKVTIRLSRAATRKGKYRVIADGWWQMDATTVSRQKKAVATVRLR